MSTINKIADKDVVVFSQAINYPNDFGTNTLDLYQDISAKSAVYPGIGTSLGLIYCALKLNGEAGELAEHVGKAMRDDNYMPTEETEGLFGKEAWHRADLNRSLTPERRTALLKECGDQLWYIARISAELGASLSEVALLNLEKLRDRTERGKLQGSGDER